MKRKWYNWPRPAALVGKLSPAPWYNTFCITVGLWMLTDQWGTFFGYLLLAEGVLWTIEHAGQWKDET
jgi:hypothetical protein